MTPDHGQLGRGRSCVVIALTFFTSAILPACSQDAPETASPVTTPVVEKKQPDLLVFPDELRVGEEGVNRFVERAMGECASGDYERFRLLWATREEPLARKEYEQGWQAVREIRIQLLREIVLEAKKGEAGEQAFVVAADVLLDPQHPAGQKEPSRRVMLLAVREKDEWRLATAPGPVRAWVESQLPSEKTDEAGVAGAPVTTTTYP